MKATQVKAIAVILAIFVLGLAIGWSGGSYMVRRKIKQMVAQGNLLSKEFIIERMSRKLDLTDAQQAEIEPIVGETEVELQQFLRRSRIEFAGIMTRMTTQVKAHLPPVQQQKVDENFGHFLERWQIPPTPEKK
jgi:uncharacterized protein YneF (UPF0154 family)